MASSLQQVPSKKEQPAALPPMRKDVLSETAIVTRVLSAALSQKIQEASDSANKTVNGWLAGPSSKSAPKELAEEIARIVDFLKEAASQNPDAKFGFDTSSIAHGSVRILAGAEKFGGISINVGNRCMETHYLYIMTTKTGKLHHHKFWHTGKGAAPYLAEKILNYNPSQVPASHDDGMFTGYG